MSLNKRRGSGSSCSATGCTMRRGTNLLSQVKMFHFPVDPVRRAAWCSALKRENWAPNKNSLLCNAHFVTGKPSLDPQDVDFAPSIFNFKRENKTRGKILKRHDSLSGKPCSNNGETEDSLWTPSGTSVVCGKHFKKEDYSVSTKRRILNGYAIPSIFPGYPDYLQPEVKKARLSLHTVPYKNMPAQLSVAPETSNNGECRTECVRNMLIHPVSESSDCDGSEQISCVTHVEAFGAAKTLLHYMMNQDDVNSEDIGFILSLTQRIEKKLSVKK